MATDIYPPPQRFAFARDRRDWRGAISTLEADADGALLLTAVPAPADGRPIVLPAPYNVGVSGIAAGPCEHVFVADTVGHRLVIRTARGALATIGSGTPGPNPGQFWYPRGLATTDDALFVADSGNRRIQAYAFPALEPHLVIGASADGPLQHPSAVATDSSSQLYVIDDGLRRVYRFSKAAVPDAAFTAAVVAQNILPNPLSVAVTDDDGTVISDADRNVVVLLDKDGTLTGLLADPSGGTWQPGVVAAHAARIYVHDRASGHIHGFANSGNWLGQLPSWHGPVSAMACTETGHLLIKPGLDAEFVAFGATNYTTQGSILWGPLDAGEQLEWYRAAADMFAPAGTSVRIDIAQLDAPAPPPSSTEWIPAPSPDVLLALVVQTPPPATRRWLWVRATLTSTVPEASPTLLQLRAETPGEDYLDCLPAIYRLRDQAGQLSRTLALGQSEQSVVDEALDAMPQRWAPDFAPFSTLPWLAAWLGFELPADADDGEARGLVASAVAFSERRGTPASIRAVVKLYTGVEPRIVEAFTSRATWVLDQSSQLGFDTALPIADPDGVLVSERRDSDGAMPCCDATAPAAIVGEAMLMPADRFAEALFDPDAYRFDVVVPRHLIGSKTIEAVRAVVEREKPAHTQYRLCIVEPQLAVGFQSRVGIDTIVGGPPPAFRLDDAVLEAASLGTSTDLCTSRVGVNASIGAAVLS